MWENKFQQLYSRQEKCKCGIIFQVIFGIRGRKNTFEFCSDCGNYYIRLEKFELEVGYLYVLYYTQNTTWLTLYTIYNIISK